MHGRRPRLTGLLAAVATLPVLLTAGAGPAFASTWPDRFEQPLQIDNPLFPLRPGTQFIYDGTVTDAEGTHAHRIIFTVTDLVKRVDGVDSRVIWDQDINDGELSEAELSFFAQDRNSNVLTMGEYPEEYENGRFVGAPNTWISGRARAQAGILVPGHPRLGMRFVQGRAPVVDFFDVGVVRQLHAKACAASRCYPDTTLIEESAPGAPEEGSQLKFYAAGVGLVRIGAVGGAAREVMTLTRVRHLGDAELAQARAAARKLERRAYRVSAPYRQTAPMRRAAEVDDEPYLKPT